jgi:hypothetical protein
VDKIKWIRTVGICVVAISAFSVAATSTAQAAEVASCVKVSKVTIKYMKGAKEKQKGIREGRYLNKGCTEAAPEHTGRYPGYEGPEGKYERGAAGARFTTGSGKGDKHPQLEMAGEGGRKIECTGSHGEGEWTGPKSGIETVVFRGCTLNTNKAACTSAGREPGEIATSALELTLIGSGEELEQFYYGGENEVVAQHPNGPLEHEVWVESAVKAGSYYVEYSCGSLAFRTLGSVAGRVESPLNAPEKKMEWDVDPGKDIGDLYSEYSEEGGAYKPVGGNTNESYEAAASDTGGLEVIEAG